MLETSLQVRLTESKSFDFYSPQYSITSNIKETGPITQTCQIKQTLLDTESKKARIKANDVLSFLSTNLSLTVGELRINLCQ